VHAAFVLRIKLTGSLRIEFKEIRKEWKQRKKEEEAARKADEERQRAQKIPLGIHNRVRLVMHRFMVNYEHL